jgi:DNA-binding NtrC family response regulator
VTGAPALLGYSRAIRTLQAEVEAAGASDARVLITGDTGTGKEVVAQLLHAQSPRHTRGPLVALNCASVVEALIESELFGHEAGSFTGADRQRRGILASADGGAVFLDEVGELSPRLQNVLLRFLDNGEIQRVGATSATRVNVRVIAATNVDLDESVKAGRFRRDLYYRLNVLRLQTTALRERRDDIPVLLSHFLASYANDTGGAVPELTDAATDWLVQYDWPGNVRQLRNIAESLVATRRSGPVDVCHLTVRLRDCRSPAGPDTPLVSTLFETLYRRMSLDGESFWATFHPAFMARDLTRADLRSVIARALTTTHGNYPALVRLFNMEAKEGKRFMTFLGKHECRVDPHRFTSAGGRSSRATSHETGEAPTPHDRAGTVVG